MATLLYRSAGSPDYTPSEPSFPDVPPSNPFYMEIEWLVASDFADGHPDGTFRPGTAVSRGAMAKFLYRVAGSPDFTPSEPSFLDVPPSHPFYMEIEWLVASDVAHGYPDATFRPGTATSRGAMATFLHAFSEL
jgi:hypothetical protein